MRRAASAGMLGSLAVAVGFVMATPSAEASFPGRKGDIAIATARWPDCGDCGIGPNFIWTLARGKPAARLFPGLRVAFSPSGRWLASTAYAIHSDFDPRRDRLLGFRHHLAATPAQLARSRQM